MEGESVVLGDICTRIFSGGTPLRSCKEYYNSGNVPWLNSGEVDFNRLRATKNAITDVGMINSNAKWLVPPAVVLAMYGATAGRSAIALSRMTTNQACCVLEVDDRKADYEFVYYYLKNNYTKLSRMSNGAAQQNLSVGAIKKMAITLPSLSHQKRISTVLKAFDARLDLNNQINDYLAAQCQPSKHRFHLT